MGETYTYRISPLHNKIIERKADNPDARWCFYKVCDSPKEAKRSLAIINGEMDTEQMALLPQQEQP